VHCSSGYPSSVTGRPHVQQRASLGVRWPGSAAGARARLHIVEPVHQLDQREVRRDAQRVGGVADGVVDLLPPARAPQHRPHWKHTMRAVPSTHATWALPCKSNSKPLVHRGARRAARRAHQSDLTCSSVGAEARVSGAGFQSAAVSVMLIGLPRAAA